MSNEAILKKSLFGGFRKSDVINYVEQIQAENISLKKELEEKAQLLEKYEEANDNYDSLKTEYDELLAKADSLAEENSTLAAQNEEYSSRLEQCEGEARRANDALLEAETRFNSLTDEYKRLSDDRANAVIKDAMKYADSIVAAAKEDAAQILVKAGATITSVSSEISESAARVKTAQSNLAFSLDSVQSGVDSLLGSLSDYAAELRED